jgi:ABC-type branched-subunit amino acid transport system ATPase component
MDTVSTSAPLPDPTTELPMPILSATDIDFCYGRMQVLFGVSIDLFPGEALALLGTNGAGKSTLLRAICGLEPPVGGQVMFDGQDVTAMPAEKQVSRGLVLIPGGRAVFPDMSVEENLRMQALTVRKNRAWVRERRELVMNTFPRLAERRSQPAGYLSGGEQQQLALAKALILDPKVLCIDELSLGLAPVIVAELMEIVSEIHRSGVALLVVEQSLNIAAELCARTVFMEKGRLRFEGRTAELLERDDIARAVFLGEVSG